VSLTTEWRMKSEKCKPVPGPSRFRGRTQTLSLCFFLSLLDVWVGVGGRMGGGKGRGGDLLAPNDKRGRNG